jgi:hypothetical protein
MRKGAAREVAAPFNLLARLEASEGVTDFTGQHHLVVAVQIGPSQPPPLDHLEEDQCAVDLLGRRGAGNAGDAPVNGVSDKVARCVMMYTMEFEVLPVDAHVHRVARRLGWTNQERPEHSHEELEALVPPNLRYTFHVDCVAHGRELCRPIHPRCSPCALKLQCVYYKGTLAK